MNIVKRNGQTAEFDRSKIINAVEKAFRQVESTVTEYAHLKANNIANHIEQYAQERDEPLTVEEIQNMVEHGLMSSKRKDVARAYITYRYDRDKERILKSDLEQRYQKLHKLVTGQDSESEKENSNKDTRILPTMRDYIAGFTCRELASNVLLPADIAKAHEEGIIHFHDSDYSPAMPITNCCLINLEDMLQNGTVISGIQINKPHSFRTACTIATQIITQVASSQYGN